MKNVLCQIEGILELRKNKLIAVPYIVVGRHYKTPENIVSALNQKASRNIWNAIRKQNICVGRVHAISLNWYEEALKIIQLSSKQTENIQPDFLPSSSTGTLMTFSVAFVISLWFQPSKHFNDVCVVFPFLSAAWKMTAISSVCNIVYVKKKKNDPITKFR